MGVGVKSELDRTFNGLRQQFDGARLYTLKESRIVASRDDLRLFLSLSDKGRIVVVSAWAARNFAVPAEGTPEATARIHLGVLALLREARSKAASAALLWDKGRLALESCARALSVKGIHSSWSEKGDSLIVSDSKSCRIVINLRSGFLQLSMSMISSSGEEIAERLAALENGKYGPTSQNAR